MQILQQAALDPGHCLKELFSSRERKVDYPRPGVCSPEPRRESGAAYLSDLPERADGACPKPSSLQEAISNRSSHNGHSSLRLLLDVISEHMRQHLGVEDA